MSRHTVAWVVLLAAAWSLRAYLVVQGGQYYWPDEGRYRGSQLAAEHLMHGDATGAVTALVRPDHTLFPVLGVAPALLEQHRGASSRIPALFFATFSVVGIWLLGRIASALHAAPGESLLAGVLLASSTTWTYYSRHLLPYDAAMTFALGALLASAHGARHGLIFCGLLSSAAFLSYSGVWAIVAFTLTAAVVMASHDAKRLALNVLIVATAFVLPIASLFAITALLGRPLLREYLDFAGTVSQGRFGEGWSLPFEYFWHAEHGIALIWLACLVSAALAAWQSSARARHALAGVVFVYVALVVTSVVLEVFVVYGRTARQLVPFLCLLAAHEIGRWQKRAPRVILLAVVVGAVGQVAYNLHTPIVQVFPDRFRIDAAQAAASPREELTFIYANHIYPTPEKVDVTGARVLAAAPHPLQFLPYQYEGFTPEERQLLRTTDIRMQLVAR